MQQKIYQQRLGGNLILFFLILCNVINVEVFGQQVKEKEGRQPKPKTITAQLMTTEKVDSIPAVQLEEVRSNGGASTLTSLCLAWRTGPCLTKDSQKAREKKTFPGKKKKKKKL